MTLLFYVKMCVREIVASDLPVTRFAPVYYCRLAPFFYFAEIELVSPFVRIVSKSNGRATCFLTHE
jgi:hypothetical protein